VHRPIPEDVSLHVGLTDVCNIVKIVGFEEGLMFAIPKCLTDI